MCRGRHPHEDWLKSLRLIQRRFVRHFTPTSASWPYMPSGSSAASRRIAPG